MLDRVQCKPHNDVCITVRKEREKMRNYVSWPHHWSFKPMHSSKIYSLSSRSKKIEEKREKMNFQGLLCSTICRYVRAPKGASWILENELCIPTVEVCMRNKSIWVYTRCHFAHTSSIILIFHTWSATKLKLYHFSRHSKIMNIK